MGKVNTNSKDEPVTVAAHNDISNGRLFEDKKLVSLLQPFDIAQPKLLYKKLANLHQNADPLELWADFDNTLTARSYGIYEALRNALPPLGRIESDAERRVNLAKERDGSLSIEDNIAWTKREIGRYAQYGVTTDDIMHAVETIRLRAGARRLFSFCDKSGIKRHIVSASIADAIELVGLHPSHIHSNKLHIKDGIVIGWDEENLLHAHNKQLHTRVILTEAKDTYTNGWKVILGDSRHDVEMIPGDNVLRIRVCGKSGNSDEYLYESFIPTPNGAYYDLVLRKESLLPIVRLLRRLATH